MIEQDEIPPGMTPAPPRFDNEGRPICQLCGDLLTTGFRTGGNWALGNKKKGVHMCDRHATSALYRLKKTKRERAKRTEAEPPRREWMPALEFHKMVMGKRKAKEARRQARREESGDLGLPLVDLS